MRNFQIVPVKYTRLYRVAFVMCTTLFTLSSARTFYVAPDGNNSASGTISQPFATLQKANDVVAAGDTVYVRGGTYRITTPANSGAGISITKSGTSDSKRICFWAYPGEIPVFDFSNLAISTSTYTHGFVVSGSWLHFKGLEICKVPMNTNSNCGMQVVQSGNNIFELMNFHHNSGAGVFVNDSKGRGGHLFLNCDSHDNYDPNGRQGDGQNADGFGVHYQTSGEVTVFRGCRAWWNSDDGWDFISQEVPVIIENCLAMGNGWVDFGTKRPADGNGNGFKAGSSKNGIRHVIKNSVAWKNRASGFYANHSAGGNTWYNNTSYSNGTQYNMLASSWDAAGNRTDGVTLTGSKVHIMRNNIGFPNKNSYMNGVDTKFNTWDLNVTPQNADFLSVTDPSMTVTGRDLSSLPGVLGPRQADGSVPNTDFLKLSSNSQMIDKGTDVGLVFKNKPDLGAFEFGLDNSNAVYHKVITNAAPGGSIRQDPAGDSLREGSSITFTAVPHKNWTFTGWSGAHTGTAPSYSISSLDSDITLRAMFKFTSTDSSLYEGEDATLINSIIETTNSGFSGSGYANFNNEVGSAVEFPVCVSQDGQVSVKITFSNGSSVDCPVSVSVNGSTVIKSLSFDPTGTWTAWNTQNVLINLIPGVNTIRFTSLTSDGGPNVDKIELNKEIITTVGSPQKDPVQIFKLSGYTVQASCPGKTVVVQLYSLDGKRVFRRVLRGIQKMKLPVDQIDNKQYILQVTTENFRKVQTLCIVK